jgi:hypothetical protein
MLKIILFNSLFVFLMNYSIPVIYIHKGDSFYLKSIFSQAKKFNNELILLGDESNNKYNQVFHHNISDYSYTANEFKKIYFHCSPNSYDFELFCFERWFVLKDFMKNNNISACFYCDSDMKLYINMMQEYEKWKKFDAAFLTPNLEKINNKDISRWQEYGGMISYWRLDALEDFCSFIMNLFENPWKLNHLLDNWNKYHFPYSPLTDMLAFQEWFEMEKNIKVGKINDIVNDETFDNSLYLSEDAYELIRNPMLEETRDGDRCLPFIKNIIMINGQPYCYNYKLKKMIKFKSIHFQTLLKKLINLF